MNKKKILLLGATGMAGHVAYLYLKNTNKFELLPVVYKKKLTPDSVILDVSNKDSIANLIKEYRPDYIINCIGILIKGASDYPDNAILINSFLPHFLAKVADQTGGKLIHISTDCVFSGKKGGYSETDFKDADDIYGRSKALGEVSAIRHLTLRTSIIGPELKTKGEGLFHWFMMQKGEVSGFTQAFWGGVTTLELAKAIEKSIEHNLFGLAHVTNGKKISKYDLINLFKSIWNTATPINEMPGKSVDKSLLKSAQFDFEVPSYEQMLLDQNKWMQNNRDLYLEIYPGLLINS